MLSPPPSPPAADTSDADTPPREPTDREPASAEAAYRDRHHIDELERRISELTSRLTDAERRAADVLELRAARERDADQHRDALTRVEHELEVERLEGGRLRDSIAAAEHAAGQAAEETARTEAATRLELQDLRSQLETAMAARTRAEATLAQVVASPSWRVTAPLRAVKRLFARR